MAGKAFRSKKVLTVLKQNRTKYNIIAFDTEDNGSGSPDNFICAAFCGVADGKPVSEFFTERKKARAFLFRKWQKPVLYFAHNLAYDLNNLDYPEGTTKLLSGKSRLIGAFYLYGQKKSIYLDTGNFFYGATINQLGEMIGRKKSKFDVLKLRGKKWDDFNKSEKACLKMYCMRDSEICYSIAQLLQELVQEEGTRLKGCWTAASMAMRIFRTKYLREKLECRSRLINDIERLAYYGGRTEVFDYGFYNNVIYEDIVSSYPAAMLYKRYPHPCYYSLHQSCKWSDIKSMEGISLVRISVPDMHIPPLPYRDTSGNGKLIFPIGEWTAAYTHPELRMAEKHGARIKAVYASILYKKTWEPFGKYIYEFYRKKERSSGIRRSFYKLLLNSLYGKWGEKREEIIRDNINRISMDDIYGKVVDISDSNGWVTLTGDRLPDPKHAFPVLAAYVSSYGRIKLFEERLCFGNIHKNNILYCDTDSCVSLKSPAVNCGSGLGQWEFRKMECFQAVAPKFYEYEGSMKLKGMPKRAKIRIEKNGMLTGIYERPLKLAEAIRRNMKPNKWIKIDKKVRIADDKRIKLGTDSNPILVYRNDSIRTFECALADRGKY